MNYWDSEEAFTIRLNCALNAHKKLFSFSSPISEIYGKNEITIAAYNNLRFPDWENIVTCKELIREHNLR